jgi:hypothetical protein
VEDHSLSAVSTVYSIYSTYTQKNILLQLIKNISLKDDSDILYQDNWISTKSYKLLIQLFHNAVMNAEFLCVKITCMWHNG